MKSLIEQYRHLKTGVTHRTETGRWIDERAELHQQIVDDFYSRHAHVPSQRRAIMGGGLPGSGKTTIIRTHAGVDLHDYIVVSPDVMKTELIKRNALPSIPDADVAPMELSPLIHEESWHLKDMLVSRAQADGKNVILDVGMTNRPGTEQTVTELLAHGYRLRALFVDLPIQVSAQRASSGIEKQWSSISTVLATAAVRFQPSSSTNSYSQAEGRATARCSSNSRTNSMTGWYMTTQK